MVATDLAGQLIAEPALGRGDPCPNRRWRRRTETELRAWVGFGLWDERRYRSTTLACGALPKRAVIAAIFIFDPPSLSNVVAETRNRKRCTEIRIGFLGTVYLVVGGIFAPAHHYYSQVRTAKSVSSAALAIVRWPLILLRKSTSAFTEGVGGSWRRA